MLAGSRLDGSKVRVFCAVEEIVWVSIASWELEGDSDLQVDAVR